MRGINERFINDLKQGELSFFLEQVLNDRRDYSLEIRGNYINIYYRGGNLVKITQKKLSYAFEFDLNYCRNKGENSNHQLGTLLDKADINSYIKAFSVLKEEMDSWFACHPKPEREYQHQLLVHNPSVIDIEYAVSNRMRLDMLMVKDSHLFVMENKYGNGAISGTAGLAKHYRDITDILNNETLWTEMYQSVENIVQCKRELGLSAEPLCSLKTDQPEILFLLAAYNPRSRSLNNEISKIEKVIPARILFTGAEEYDIDLNKAEDLFEYGN